MAAAPSSRHAWLRHEARRGFLRRTDWIAIVATVT